MFLKQLEISIYEWFKDHVILKTELTDAISQYYCIFVKTNAALFETCFKNIFKSLTGPNFWTVEYF